MFDATFNGAEIFGTCICNHEDPPNANQVNHYPGTDGIERLDLGVAESYTVIHGELVAATPEDLGAACQTIRALKQNAVLGTLVDTDGVSWDDAVIESFRTIGRAVQVPGQGLARKYECRIIHTGIPPTGTGEPDTTGGGTGTE
jgi:hypothetical protein